MKLKVAKFLLGFAIYISIFIPMWLCKPLHIGLDPTIYPEWFDYYMQFFLTMLCVGWFLIVQGITNWLFEGAINE